MHQLKLLVLVILVYGTVALGGCQGRDADQTRNADESELSQSSPAPRGAPGNPRGPTDPSRNDQRPMPMFGTKWYFGISVCVEFASPITPSPICQSNNRPSSIFL